MKDIFNAHQRFSIRKYSFGAASVLLGTVFLAAAPVAHAADEVQESSDTSASTDPSTPESSSTSYETTANSSENTYGAPASTGVSSTNSSEADPSTSSASSANASDVEVKATINKDTLKAKIAALQAAIKAADKETASSVIDFANEVVTDATAVLDNADATQTEVDAQVKVLTEAVTTVNEASKQAKEAVADEKAAAAAATQPAEKTELEKTVSEAVVTNRLANNFVEKEAKEKDVAVDLTDAVKAAVANNEATITASNQVLADKEATTDALKTATAQLQSSIEAVYVSLRKAGKEEFSVALAETTGTVGGVNVQPNAQDYISIRQEDGTYKTVATETNVSTATGKDIYTFTQTGLTGDAVDVTIDNVSGDITTLEAVIASSQRTGSETNPGNGQYTTDGGKYGHNNTGRMDYPLTGEKARELAAEAELWRGKLRADGSTISTNSTAVYSAGGGYEYLATHIYQLVYEQGTDRVYIPKIKERFGVTETAANAGWAVTSVEPTNLPPGLIYDSQSDSVQGVIISPSFANGVQDMRTYVTYTNSQTGATVRALYRNLRAGWIGWQDTTAPVIDADGQVFSGKVGETTFTNEKGESVDYVDIQYGEKSGSRAMGGGANVTYTLADGRTTTVRHNYNVSTTGISGNLVTSTSGTVETSIPGLSYRLDGNKKLTDASGEVTGYTGKALISGTPTEAGVYYVTAYAKDWNQASTANAWTTQGQETRARITFTISPKVEVLNIATYGTEVPVTISKGATYATITMPDGTVTAVENQNGQWVVVADGTTNTAVSAGDVLGTVGEQFKLKVTTAATATAGVDNISVYAKTENVLASLMRSTVTLKDVDGSTHVATLNASTGRWELPSDYTTVKTEHSDGTYNVTQREVYTSVQSDGSIDFYIYAYNRTYSSAGVVTAVNAVTREKTSYAKENTEAGNGLYITVTYDKSTNTWTASDGSTVTATKNGENKWTVSTSSGYTGEVKGSVAESTDKATIINSKPTATSTSYESTLNTTVNLLDRTVDGAKTVTTAANVTIKDTEDDSLPTSTDAEKTFQESHNTKITSVTVTDPEGNTVAAYTTSGDAHNYPTETTLKLTKVGVYTVTVKVVDSNTNLVDGTEVGETTSGTDHGVNTSTAETVYTITVKANIVGTPATSTDIQGATQTGQPTFTFDDADKSAINQGTKTYTLASTEAKDDSGKVVGTYSIDATTGVVTFVPEKDYSGTPTAAEVTLSVKIDDNTTLTATSTYTPTVVPAKPTGVDDTSIGFQGDTQTGKPTFTPGSAEVNGTTKTIPLATDSYKLVTADGTVVTDGETTPAYKEDGKTQIGTYAIDKSTGVVTFTPTDKTYAGKVTGITVQVADTNGTTATATYTPEIVEVKPTAAPSETTGSQGATQTSKIVYDATGNSDDDKTTLNFAKGTATVNGESKSVELDKTSVKLVSATDGTVNADGTEVVVDGQGTYKLVQDTTGATAVTFTPLVTYTGTANPVTVSIADANGTTVTTTYTPTVTPVTAKAEPATSTGTQGSTQSGTPTYTAPEAGEGVTVTPTYTLDNGQTTKTVENVGTYTIDTTGKVTFVPVASYVTTDDNKTSVGVNVTYTLEGADGTTTEVKADTTYTPTVTPVTSEGNSVTTENIQGATQKSTDESKSLTYTISDTSHITARTYAFEDGSKTKTVEKVGTYTVDDNGQVTFVPVASYTGTPDAVTVVETATLTSDDKSTTSITTKSTYTPTVVAVKPTAEASKTEGVQGATQTSAISYDKADEDNTTLNFTKGSTTVNGETKSVDLDQTSVKLVDASGTAVDTVTVDGEGTYSLVKDTDGNVTAVKFVPVPEFTGEATPVTVQATDKNGTPVTTTYTPYVTPVAVESTDKTSTDVQGQPQSETPEFTVDTDSANKVSITDRKLVDPTTGASVTSYEVTNVGKYEIDSTTGKVTFTPTTDFVGEAPAATVVASVTVENENGEKATVLSTATYTPTVVPVTPTATESSTTGIQGATQKSEVVLDSTDNNVDTLNFNKGTATVDGTEKSVDLDSSTLSLVGADSEGKVTVAGQGTYSIVTEDGKTYVQFVPEKSYVGDVTPVTVSIKDANGTEVTTTYTPKIVGVSPVADASATTGNQGKPQTSTIVYDAANNSDGKSTTLNFAGGSADINGTKQTVALDKTSVTLVSATNGTVNADGSITVADQGTYTLEKDDEGNVIGVTFTPTADFVGTANPVTVRISDVNGNTAETTYTPTVVANGTLVINYVDTEGKKIQDSKTTSDLESGSKYTATKDDKITAADKIVYYYKQLADDSAGTTGTIVAGETTTVTFVYEKAGSVTVNYVDKNGKEIKSPVKDVENGKPGDKYDTTDKKETTITTEDGKTYRLVPNETKGSETGTITSGVDTQVTYVYEEVKTPETTVVTKFVDRNGNPVAPEEKGAQEAKTIPGYVLVETRKDSNGNIVYVYDRVKPTPTDVTPAKPDAAVTPAQSTTQAPASAKQLPNTGTENRSGLAALGLAGLLGGLGLVSRKKKED